MSQDAFQPFESGHGLLFAEIATAGCVFMPFATGFPYCGHVASPYRHCKNSLCHNRANRVHSDLIVADEGSDITDLLGEASPVSYVQRRGAAASTAALAADSSSWPTADGVKCRLCYWLAAAFSFRKVNRAMRAVVAFS
jgi:hypothetical protein